MKKLTKLLAIALSLLLACLPCARAEENSTYYSLSLLDPVYLVDDETVLDLTGFNVDLVAALSDGAEQMLGLELYSGENYDYITGLQLQTGEEGLVAFLDGMSNSYRVAYSDIAQLINASGALDEMNMTETVSELMGALGASLAQLALRTTLQGAVESFKDQLAMLDVDPRWIPVYAAEGQIVLDENGQCVIPFELSEEAATELLNQLAAVSTDFPFEGLTAAGTLTVYGEDPANIQKYDLDCAGTLTVEGETGTYAIAGNASADDLNLELTIAGPDAEADDVLSLVIASGEPEGSVVSSYSVNLLEGSDVLATVWIENVEEDGSWTNLYYANDVDEKVTISVARDYQPDFGHSWGFLAETYSGEADAPEDYSCVYFSYAGDDMVDESGEPYISGQLAFGVEEAGQTQDITLRVILSAIDVDKAEWALDYDSAVDAMTMDNSDLESAAMGAVGVLGEVAATLQEEYPEAFTSLGSAE